MISIRPTASSSWWARCSTLALTLLLAVVLAITLEAGIAHAATFTVSNTSDSGDGSLQDAITDANATPNAGGPDDIVFDIQSGCDATSGVCTITPASALPEITEAVVIDGYSQSGASPNTLATGNNAVLKIELSGATSGAGTVGIRISGANSVVRGLIINRWERDGVRLLGTEASGNRIEGNFIGTDASGQEDLGNGDDGVFISLAPSNTVGGTVARARNVISGNGDDGIDVREPEASGNRIQGNHIGTDASGQGALGNSDEGVVIIFAPNNVVGGTSAAATNTIAFNGADGVDVDSPPDTSGGEPGTGNSVLRNSIFDNDGLGIELGNDGVTPNDPQDPDPGPNLLQNFPVITSATTPNGRSVSIQGTLNSNPNDTFTIQLLSSRTRDPSGYGEGKTYLGQTNVTANAGGNAVFSFSANAPVAAGEFVTATATNVSTGDTSEFSRAVGIQDETNPTVVSTNPQNGATGVPARADVFATFSEAMNPSTINPNTFKLFRQLEGGGQTQVPAAVSYNEEARRARLDPNANLTPGTRYVGLVTERARDLAGNGLAQRKTFYFVVAR